MSSVLPGELRVNADGKSPSARRADRPYPIQPVVTWTSPTQ
ncbi:hypothetical protein ABT288_03640 [Streptomyces sp. NPDC001093]